MLVAIKGGRGEADTTPLLPTSFLGDDFIRSCGGQFKRIKVCLQTLAKPLVVVLCAALSHRQTILSGHSLPRSVAQDFCFQKPHQQSAICRRLSQGRQMRGRAMPRQNSSLIIRKNQSLFGRFLEAALEAYRPFCNRQFPDWGQSNIPCRSYFWICAKPTPFLFQFSPRWHGRKYAIWQKNLRSGSRCLEPAP